MISFVTGWSYFGSTALGAGLYGRVNQRYADRRAKGFAPYLPSGKNKPARRILVTGRAPPYPRNGSYQVDPGHYRN